MVGKPLGTLLGPAEAQLLIERAVTMTKLRAFAQEHPGNCKDQSLTIRPFGPFIRGEDAIWKLDGDDGCDISEEPNDEWTEGWDEEFRMKDNQYAKDFELFKKAIREGRRYKVDPRTGSVRIPELKHLEREDNWVRSTITNEVMPKGDQKILQCVCKFMLRHSDRANLESMKSHVNHFYKIVGLPGP